MGTKFNGTVEEKLSLDTFIKLTRACNSVVADVGKVIADSGLTECQFGVLEALYHLGEMSQKNLSEKLLKSGGNITMVIDNLEKNGLVVRKKNIMDRRCYWISLTKKGHELIKNIFPQHVKLICSRMSVLSASEQKNLGKLLKKLGIVNIKN
ncbi:MAG: MarR family transcriptional regulator [Candidatus Rifleibacteriota bacterium]